MRILSRWLIKQLDKLLVKNGYYNRKYVCRMFTIRNITIGFIYLVSVGKKQNAL